MGGMTGGTTRLGGVGAAALSSRARLQEEHEIEKFQMTAVGLAARGGHAISTAVKGAPARTLGPPCR